MKFPHIVIYTEKLPSYAAGYAVGPIIRIRPKYKDDAGLHRHEYEHVRQWYMTLFLHPLFYGVSRKYRLWSEANAYAKQIEGDNIDSLARRLAMPVFDLGITPDEARREIEKYL